MTKTTAPGTVTLTPINNPSGSIHFGLMGDSTYAQAGSGSGGWQIVERPKRVAATQWFDRAPWSLTFEGIIVRDRILEQGVRGIENNDASLPRSIENTCTRLESWLDPVPNTLEPPVLSATGPVPGIKHLWCLYSLEFMDALRHPTRGWRYQQHVKIVLYEYSPPFGNLSVTQANGQVETFNYNTNTGEYTFTTHIVKKGETVKKIANHYKVSAKRILQLNNIRDPRHGIVPGLELIIPNK